MVSMKNKYSRYSTLFDYLKKNSIILTATSRLKNKLISTYLSHYFSESKSGIIFDIPIFSLSELINKLYYSLSDLDLNVPNVLDKQQEGVLWLESVTLGHDMINFNLNKTAKMVENAWSVITQWEIPFNELELYQGNTNTSQMLKWIEVFQNKLEGKITSVQLLSYIKVSPHLKDIFQYDNVVTIGFDTITKQLESFFHVISDFQVDITHWHLPTINSDYQVFSAPSFRDELYHVANQVKDYIKNFPHHDVAIVCPQLQKNHKLISSVMDEVMGFSLTIKNSDRNYMISGGYSLFEVPLINDLFSILFLSFANDYEDMSQVILSPYISDALDYRDERHKIDLFMRNNSYRDISYLEFLEIIKFNNFNSIESFYALKNINIKGKYTWQGIISLVLRFTDIMGWPGRSILSSEDYQAVEQFHTLLDTLQTLEPVFSRKVSFLEGINQLKILSREMLFQPESNSEVSVSILGILEASSITFDKIWCVNMGEEDWPVFSNPNPLIPRTLSTKYQVPHCSYDHEYDICKAITARLLNQAPFIVLSFSCNKDNYKQNLSSFFQRGEITHLPNEKISHYAQSEKLSTCISLDTNIDQIRPYTNPPGVIMKGGSTLLKDISRCNFKSVCKHRLFLSKIPNFIQPLNPLQKGILLHSVLEKIWTKISSSMELSQLNQSEFNSLIKYAIEESIIKINIPKKLYYLLEFEKDRIFQIVSKWLLYEKSKRFDFEVLSKEFEVTLTLLDIILKLKIDRLDKVNGKKIVIDYKTTKRALNTSSWINDISDPQLPLYSLACNMSGVFYAQINDDTQKLIGISDNVDIADKVNTNISNLVNDIDNIQGLNNHWEEKLSSYLMDYKRGNINLKVRQNGDSPCLSCAYSNLCRYKQYIT